MRLIMPLIVTDQIGAAVSVLACCCVPACYNTHILIRVYMASQVNVLSAGRLVSSQIIYLTLCYLAILVTLQVHRLS